jgi:O-antigen ligase
MRGTALIGGLAVAAGASAGALHPTAALGIVLGFAVIAWVLSNALNATLAFIVVLFLRPGDIFPPVAAIRPAMLIALVAILSWLITKSLHGGMRLSRAPHGKWVLALVGATLLSSITSSWRGGSIELFTTSFVKVIIMYGLLVHVVDTETRAVRLNLTLGLCAAGLALYVIYQRSLGLATIEGTRAGFVGVLEDPNDLALVLVTYVPLFTELALGARGLRRLPWVFLLAILVTGVFGTVSRGGALGLLVALAFTFYDRGRLSLRLLLVPVLTMAVIGMLVLAGLNDRTSGAYRPGELDDSAQGRLDIWEAGVRMTADNPAFGVGFGQFGANYGSYRASGAVGPRGWRAPHNSFVQVAGETGLVGFIPFMALVSLTFAIGYRLRKARVPEEGPMERAVRRSYFPSMAGFCVGAFFLSQAWGSFFFIMFAQSAAAYEIWKPELDPPRLSGQVGTERAGSVNDEDAS